MKKPIITGIAGSLALLSLYFIILAAANSFAHALEQFLSMWYWIAALVIGFGIQVGLYSHVRLMHKRAATAEVAAAGGISTASMIACCAHHVADVLPIIGLSAAAIFLLEYQIPFILLGIFSNLVGITMMLDIIQKHRLFGKKSFFDRLFRYDMRLVRNITVVASVIIVSAMFVNAAFTAGEDTGIEELGLPKQFELPAKINDENGVSIEVKPIDFSFDREVEFDVAINTHQGSLDFDLTEISVLEDGRGNKYKPLKWDGSPPGGHHRSGVLTFPKLGQVPAYIKLIIRDVYGVPERTFLWELDG